jgi:AcrR family transcriptional regulator
MARDATRTRARLIRAGERRFARDGVTGARLSDIVRDAGQGNDSAVGYHFGSRQGLLQAIVERHLAAMDRARTVPPADATLPDLVGAIVEPTAALLLTEEGRDFLRIMEQVADWSGLGTGRPNAVLAGTVL